MTRRGENEVIIHGRGPTQRAAEQTQRLALTVVAPELTVVIPTLNEVENVDL